MKNRPEDDRQITEYLLGSLPAAESERIDELSIADDDFAVRLQAVENELVDAYVRGELSEQTRDRFRSVYLSSPVRRKKVEFARTFLGLTDRESRAPAPSAAREEWWRLPWPAPAMQRGLAAAGFLLALTAGWLAFDNRRLHSERDAALAARRMSEQLAEQLRRQLAERSQTPAASPATQSPYIAAFALAPQLRGAGDLPSVTIPATAEYVTLQLELETRAHAAWKAELKALPARETVWTSEALTAYSRDRSRIVPVSLPPRLLQPGVYMAVLTSMGQAGAEETTAVYTFRVIDQ